MPSLPPSAASSPSPLPPPRTRPHTPTRVSHHPDPTVFFLSLSFLRHPPPPLSFLRAKTRSPTTSYPFLCPPELALIPRYLPLLLILRTTRHLTTRTSVSLSPSSCTYSYIPFSRLLSVSSRPSRLGLSRFYRRLVHDTSPTCTIVRLPRAFTSRNARSSLRRAYYTDGVYAEHYARSDSLM